MVASADSSSLTDGRGLLLRSGALPPCNAEAPLCSRPQLRLILPAGDSRSFSGVWPPASLLHDPGGCAASSVCKSVTSRMLLPCWPGCVRRRAGIPADGQGEGASTRGGLTGLRRRSRRSPGCLSPPAALPVSPPLTECPPDILSIAAFPIP